MRRLCPRVILVFGDQDAPRSIDVHGLGLGEVKPVKDAGLGIRYTTPVGPLRFDFGYQLNPIEGLLVNGAPQTRQWRLHFSIGQAF